MDQKFNVNKNETINLLGKKCKRIPSDGSKTNFPNYDLKFRCNMQKLINLTI